MLFYLPEAIELDLIGQRFFLSMSLRELLAQHSNFSSKAVDRIIAKAEAKKTFALAMPWQFFCQHNQANVCICLGNSHSSLTSAMLFY